MSVHDFIDKVFVGLHLDLQFVNSIPDRYFVLAGTFVVAALGTLLATEFWKRHRKQQLSVLEDLELAKLLLKRSINKACVFVAFLFAAAGYVITFGDSVTPFVTIPYWGAIIGAARTIYDLRNNQFWLKLQAKYGKDAGNGLIVPAVKTTPNLPETPGDYSQFI